MGEGGEGKAKIFWCKDWGGVFLRRDQQGPPPFSHLSSVEGERKRGGRREELNFPTLLPGKKKG